MNEEKNLSHFAAKEQPTVGKSFSIQDEKTEKIPLVTENVTQN